MGVSILHQALYRKWRPATFDDVVGQDHITSVLRYECQHGKFSHAYLFCGSRGTGKTTCAKILAKALNCESPVDGSPCGKCSSCIAVENGSATDILEMDAASNNGVDNIRDIRDEVVYAPAMLKYRVYIVDEVHMLSISAFNALLKTLEEPPSHVVFILATTELHKLPSTIISRCQRFDFRRITIPVITERLLKIAEAEDIKIQRGAAQLLAKLAMGGMRDAVSLLELCAGARKEIDEKLVAETIGISSRENTAKLVRAVAEKDYETVFGTIAEVVASSKDIAVFWQDILAFYRDMLIIKTSKTADKYLDLTENEAEQTLSVASLFEKETIIFHCKLLEQAMAAIQRSSSGARLLAEMALVRMCDETLDSSNEALLARISALEDRLDAGQYSLPQAGTKEILKTEKKQEEKPVETTPSISKDAEKKCEEVKKSETSSNKKRTLGYWIDAVDKVCKNDPSLTGFLKDSKIYKNADDKIVIRFESEFSYMMIKSRASTLSAIATILSSYEKKPITAWDIELEVSREKDLVDDSDGGIDEIMNEINKNSTED